MVEVHTHKVISITDEGRVDMEVDTEHDGKWFTLRLKYGGETISLQEFGEPIVLNKIARAIDSVIQDADLRKGEK